MSLLGDDEIESAPDHMGHRARLRARFLETEGDGFADYELLELLLTLAIPRRDVKPLAKSLLRRFGTFAGVISASQLDLSRVDGVADTTIAALKLAQVSALRLARQQVMNSPVLNSWQRLSDYLTADMAHRGTEHFRLLFLDAKNHLIADEIQQSGSVSHTPVYPREIVQARARTWRDRHYPGAQPPQRRSCAKPGRYRYDARNCEGDRRRRYRRARSLDRRKIGHGQLQEPGPALKAADGQLARAAFVFAITAFFQAIILPEAHALFFC